MGVLMENEVCQLKHDLLVGYMNGNELTDTFPIGHALKFSDADYYMLRLWPLPGTTYYLARNRDGGKYTIYSKRVVMENGVKFQNPIGFASMRDEVKEYIEIFLRFPRQRLFMSLFPAA
jgi:hypothetical protein